MNGVEQVARFTAVKRAEKRLDDVELLLTALAAEIVKDRETIRQDLQVFNERLRVYAEREAERLDATDRIQVTTCQERWDAASATHVRLSHQHFQFIGMTLWQRLRWLVRGV